MIGPELPPGFRPPAAATEESEHTPPFIGPPLPPPRKVYGPSIDPPPAAAASSSASESSSDEDSDGGEYGPLPAGAEGAAGERAAAAFEEECARAEKERWAALRGHESKGAAAAAATGGHEEWMTALPEERRGFGLLSRLMCCGGEVLFHAVFVCVRADPLAARTFRKDGVAQIDKAWGASPGAAPAPAPEPAKRSHSHSHHKHKHHHKHHHKHEKESTTQQQQQPAKKSLLEEHLERVRSGAAPAKRARSDAQQSLTWRMPGTASTSSSAGSSGTAYWDRERDMEAMHLSRQSVADLLGRSEALGTRFRSGGSSTRFV